MEIWQMDGHTDSQRDTITIMWQGIKKKTICSAKEHLPMEAIT